MKFIPTDFDGLYIIEPDVFEDSRGYFMEVFNAESFRKAGILFNPVQDNESRSCRGVIRGLHYQINPFTQAKLVRVIEGKIFDIALDLRKSYATYGKWFGIELEARSLKQILIPRGFAHGFSVLSDFAVVQYKCDNLYNPSAERGIMPLDPSLGIDWKINEKDSIISQKDRKHPCLNNAKTNF